tara:strand:- start:315 stop:908 length:594 start_codon:yes stop_codon:yes gene_type:complete
MSLTEKIRTLRERFGPWLRINADPECSPEYLDAVAWRDERTPGEESDEKLELDKQAAEYGLKQFDDSVAAYERADNQAHSALRHNAYLIAGVFAFFRSQSEAIPWLVKLSLVCWMIAMLLLSIMTRRLWRPAGCDLSELQEFLDSGDRRMHAWLNGCTHLATVKLRVVINNEALIFNWALGFTITGLTFLILATLVA